MSTIEVFDPPMCCSTGVCGPSVDPALATFAGDLGALSELGISVSRYNLSQEPRAFAEDSMMRELLHERGDDALPVIRVNGELRASGRYPTRGELEAWVSDDGAADLDPKTAELVALGAAIGANCETCLKFHYNEARHLGVSVATMSAAMRVAQSVKEAPANTILNLAAKLLGATPDTLAWKTANAGPTNNTERTSPTAAQSSGATTCCSPTSTEASSHSAPLSTPQSSPCCSGSNVGESLSIGGDNQGSACCG